MGDGQASSASVPSALGGWSVLAGDAVRQASSESVGRSGSPLGERPVWVSSAALAVALAILVTATDPPIGSLASSYWQEGLFWAAVVALVNVFPVKFQSLVFTLDAPLVLAVAILYPPSLAAMIVLVATVDVREFRGNIDPSYAVFNRLQAAVSVFLASVAFHAIAADIASFPTVIFGTLAALSVDYLVNVALVLFGCLERGGKLRLAAASMRVANPTLFFGVYVGYGLLAFFLAFLFRSMGGWSVVAFLIPVMVAQQLLVRTQRLEALMGDLRERERLMQGLIDSVLDERRDERQRIAGELHDSVLQQLIKIGMIATLLRKETEEDARSRDDVQDLVDVSDDAILELRHLMEEIRESPLGRRGLTPTLDSLVRDLRLGSQTKIYLSIPDGLEVPSRVQVAAYQIAREGLINAIKHARASAIWVHMESTGDRLSVEVADDGRGFDPKATPPLHFGLRLLRERAEALGGSLKVSSGEGQGTRLEASLPTVERVHNETTPPGGIASRSWLNGRSLRLPTSPASDQESHE
jgi:signal transduction histidine kinase